MRFAVFDNELKPEPSFAWFVVQQFGAFFGPLILSISVGSALNSSGVAGEILPPAFAGLISFAIGMTIQQNSPNWAAIGRWVWVLPACLFLIAFGSDWASYSWRFVTSEFFWPGPNGEDAWVEVFLTVPSACCCLYSAGIFFARSRTMQ